MRLALIMVMLLSGCAQADKFTCLLAPIGEAESGKPVVLLQCRGGW